MRLSASTVLLLLDPGGPFHIAWLVMPVIVFSVHGMIRRWPRAKFCEKLFESFKSEFNPPPAVIREALVGRIGATAFGIDKGVELRTLLSAHQQAVTKILCGRSFPLETPATLCVAVREKPSLDAATTPTVAAAKPKPSARRWTISSDYNQAPEPRSCSEIHSWCHGWTVPYSALCKSVQNEIFVGVFST